MEEELSIYVYVCVSVGGRADQERLENGQNDRRRGKKKQTVSDGQELSKRYM